MVLAVMQSVRASLGAARCRSPVHYAPPSPCSGAAPAAQAEEWEGRGCR